ncbi:MAG: sigma-70 family RNA polymerase sigma factor [Bacteroidales bacterium]|nr:sigma-70 family RNA polymerase sigma factor [Bacteroidales bacterium]
MAKTGLKLTDHDDGSLVEMALGGGPEAEAAFFTIYARYHKGVFAHISRFIQEQEEVEDICMESFEKAFKQLDSYRPSNKFSTWIFTIARNTAFDHLDKDKVRGRNKDKMPIDYSDLEHIDVPEDNVSPEDEIISSQDHENFLSCVQGLPDLYREVASMCFVDNLGYKEISEKAGLPINTVKTRISRAKGLIVQMMLDMEEE